LLQERLMHTLRNRLSDPDLTPAAVASAHHISVRSLHYAFAGAGTTFIRELMQARLARAREMLSDPRLTDVPVIELAARCGFADPSHFARRFRRRFGLSPVAFRRSAGAGR
ncbi:MAG TPA: helix-turn-helix transcriptional regulator, partial [Steroidobacteraceae bacterium]|nr:helix-turn-helix transcriptional regulator [Steroidobacteraceae bacterium]